MHHNIFVSALLLGVASLAAAAASTSASTSAATSTSTANDSTTNKKPVPFDREQVATIEDELKQFQDSHTADKEYIAYKKFAAEKTAGALKDKNELVFNDQLKGTKDVDVEAFVTVLPSSIQSYMGSYYAGKASIVDEVRETKTVATTTRKSVPGDKEAKATDKASAKSTDAGKSTSSTGTASKNSTTTAPETSTILVSPSTTTPNSTASSTSSSATSNGASQPTGVLKAAGAVVVGLVGFAALV